jgi:hypothetical protein
MKLIKICVDKNVRVLAPIEAASCCGGPDASGRGKRYSG